MKSFSTSCSCLCPWCWNTFCFVSHIINYPWVENWFFTWSGHFCCFQAGTVSIFIFAEIKTSVFLFVDTHSCFNGSVFLHVLGKMKKWRQLVEQRKKERDREREREPSMHCPYTKYSSFPCSCGSLLPSCCSSVHFQSSSHEGFDSDVSAASL